MHTFKVLVIGADQVGKTSLVNKIVNGKFEKDYELTIGVNVQKKTFQTTRGEINVNLWDCAGHPDYCGLSDGYYINADAAICMFDINKYTSFMKMLMLQKDLKRICPSIPILTIGNKADKNIGNHYNKYNMKHIDYTTSIKNNNNYHFNEIMYRLFRQILKDPSLNFGKAILSPLAKPFILNSYTIKNTTSFPLHSNTCVDNTLKQVALSTVTDYWDEYVDHWSDDYEDWSELPELICTLCDKNSDSCKC